MRARRWLLALAVAGIAVASVATIAGAQSAGTYVIIDNFQPRCSAQNRDVVINVNGRSDGSSVNLAVYDSKGVQVASTTVFPSGTNWSSNGPLGFTTTLVGVYELRASVGGGTASAFLDVPCQPTTLTYNPTCFVVGSTSTVTMTGRHFTPYAAGYITYDVNGSETQQRIRIPIDNHGTFAATFKVTPTARDHPGTATDNGSPQAPAANATWSECPPNATTTTAVGVTTTAVGATTTVPSITVTTRPPGRGTTTTAVATTVPPVVTIPPPIAGVTLTVTPAIGPPGFVALAHGAGFPPGPVALAWAPGVGTFTATAGPDGTFDVQVLVFPRDRLGPRGLVATSGTASASAQFLVVPNTVRPSGKDVSQINRIRRFLQR
jgi:hypothetical protein